MSFFWEHAQSLLRKGSAILFLFLLSACNDSASDRSDQPFSLTTYAGKWVVLNYWAEWCAPCIKEIPELNLLQAEHEDDITVLAVNFDRVTGAELTALSEKMGIQFGLVDPDPAETLRLSRPASLPTTYIFDPTGKLAAKLVGPQTSAELLARIETVSAPSKAMPVAE